MHYISETIHHVIIIFGTHVWNDDFWRCFLFLKNLTFWVLRGEGKRTKKCPKWKIQITSVTCHISGTIHHMIVHLWRTCVKGIFSWGIFFIFFFQTFDFLGVRGVKQPQIAQNDKNFVYHAPYLRNHISYDCSFMVHLCKRIKSPGAFENFDFLGCQQPKMTKYSVSQLHLI